MKGSPFTTNSGLLNMPDVQSERPSQIVDVDVVSKSTEPQVNQGADERRSQDVYWVQKDLAGGWRTVCNQDGIHRQLWLRFRNQRSRQVINVTESGVSDKTIGRLLFAQHIILFLICFILRYLGLLMKDQFQAA